MRRIAIDAVLLPPEAWWNHAVRLNRQLRIAVPDRIVLGPSDSLPHLSLAMGCLSEEELAVAGERLRAVAAEHGPIGLMATGIHSGLIGTGEVVSTLHVERTVALRDLHEAVMQALAPLLSYESEAVMFADPEDVTPSTQQWVSAYPQAASHDAFSPHITLGVGEFLSPPGLPPNDTASRLALCQLGNYCTCKKILVEAFLR